MSLFSILSPGAFFNEFARLNAINTLFFLDFSIKLLTTKEIVHKPNNNIFGILLCPTHHISYTIPLTLFLHSLFLRSQLLDLIPIFIEYHICKIGKYLLPFQRWVIF